MGGTVYLGCLELVSSIFASVTVNDDEGLFILIVDAYSNMVRAVSSLMLSFILIKTVEQVVPAEKGNSLIQSFIINNSPSSRSGYKARESVESMNS